MRYLLQIFLLVSHGVLAQNLITSDWDGFYQKFSVTNYQGGEFRFYGYVRAICLSDISRAMLFARVDKRRGYSFFDNMKDRPITSNDWAQYTIQGKISKKAQRLFIGGMYLGLGKYYFDKFSLEIKKKEGEWESINIVNPGFEETSFNSDWQSFFDRGFESSLTTEAPYDGNSALFINTGIRNVKIEGEFINANGINFHYDESGEGDTVLLLHGNSESLRSFAKQIPALSKEFYVIAMDSRGHGYSTNDGRKVTYDLMADDVIAFLDALDINKVNIIGWSDGGIIGLILAINHPSIVKSLAIMGANLYNDETSVKSKVNRELKSELDRLIELNRPEDRFRIEMINLVLNEPNIDPKSLTKIQCPTLVMAGSKDVVKERHTKLIANKIDNSQLVIFNQGSHYEPIENPDRFNKTIMNFLKTIK